MQRNRTDPRLMMPSQQGQGNKRITRRPVPVPEVWRRGCVSPETEIQRQPAVGQAKRRAMEEERSQRDLPALRERAGLDPAKR